MVGLVSGLTSALLYVALLVGSPLGLITLFLGPLPLFLAGLSHGATAAAIGALVVSVVLALGLGGSAALSFSLAFGLPIVFLTYFALLNRTLDQEDGTTLVEWYPAGRLLTWLAGLAAALFVLAYLAALGTDGGLRGIAAEFILIAHKGTEGVAEFLAEWSIPIEPEVYIALAGTIWPAMSCISFILVICANAGFAQRLLVRTGKAIRPSPSISTLKLPEELVFFLAAALFLSFLGSEIAFLGGSLAAILIIPYFLLGLVVVHVISSGRAGRTTMLALFYGALAFIIELAFLVALVGLAEHWFELRKRFALDHQKIGKS